MDVIVVSVVILYVIMIVIALSVIMLMVTAPVLTTTKEIFFRKMFVFEQFSATTKILFCQQTFVTLTSFWGFYYKTLRIRNLQKIDKFRSKLVSFQLSGTFPCLDKHTRSPRNMCITELLCFCTTGPNAIKRFTSVLN